MEKNDRFLIFSGHSDMVGKYYVDWNEYRCGRNQDIIWTDSVAVSIAVTLYDPERKVGVLAHILGVKSAPKELLPKNVIATLLQALCLTDQPEKYPLLEATLSGEGLFESDEGKNSPTVRNILNKLGIPILGEDLCKAPGRMVFLDCSTGIVSVFRAGRLSKSELRNIVEYPDQPLPPPTRVG